MPYFCNIEPEIVAISIPILAVCGGVLIAITAIITKGRKEEQIHRERLIAMGMTGYVSKPIDQKELLSEIGRALGGVTRAVGHASGETVAGPARVARG